MKILWTTIVSFIILSIIFYSQTRAKGENKIIVLKGKAGVEAIFEMQDSFGRWIAYRNVESGKSLDIIGPNFYLQTLDNKRATITKLNSTNVFSDSTEVVIKAKILSIPLFVRQTYSFCKDGRTLRIKTSLRSLDKPVLIKRVGLLSIAVPGENFRLTGPDYVSFPIFGQEIFAGVEHPSVECQINNNTLSLSQSLYITVSDEWVDLPPAVFGSASDEDFIINGEDGLRRAFIRYLDGVRVKPSDMHVNYNDWWTAPQPSSEAFVLANIDILRKNLFDKTGFFFDSYTIDEGWADSHSVWEINRKNFPGEFKNISNSLESVGSQTGLWLSPSSLYPASLDNKWLKSNEYETTRNERLGFNACISIGGRYQTEFKKKLLKYTREANLGHIKFDGFVPSCNDSTHNHHTGAESYLPMAEGLMDVFGELRKINPSIALEPTCFGYQASPWWLMHVPFLIGPFGDDSPKGSVPAPDWIESMTTARDIRNLEGRNAFLMPSSALQTFDIVVQSPGAFQNHAVMAIGRGRWFISSYINPAFMDPVEWQFFADLIKWARDNRKSLQEPIPIGGNPKLRQAYGYAFRDNKKEFYCLRNPWMKETYIDIPRSPMNTSPREVRSIYPRREKIAKIKEGKSIPKIHLGPYETKFIKIVSLKVQKTPEMENNFKKPEVSITWNPTQPVSVTSTILNDEPRAYGPDWTCPEGDTKEIRMLKLEGNMEVKGAIQTKFSVLCEGLSIKSAFPQIELTIDGMKYPIEISRSVGAFSAGGYTNEDWGWYTASFPEGKHHVKLKIRAFTNSANFSVFLQGTSAAQEFLPPFESGISFPLYQPEIINWSHVIISPSTSEIDFSKRKPIHRKIEYIKGIYLDKMKWIDATAGWREVQLNHSIKGQTMTMGGRMFHRGIGTHAYSRIVYKRPEGHDMFAATIGCDQKALVGSLVFVVEGDGRELFRSPVFRVDTKPLKIQVPIGGTREIALIVEDGGDRINADHANWANARFLKTID